MKQKILSITLFIAIVMIAGWNISKNNDSVSVSDIALANIEALAGDEFGDIKIGFAEMSYPCFNKYGPTGKLGWMCYTGGTNPSCVARGC